MIDVNKLPDWKVEDYLKTPEDVVDFLDACLREGGLDLFTKSLAKVAHAKGYSALAEKSGINRVTLYKMFRPGSKPQFESIFKVLKALDLRLGIVSALA